MHTAYIGMGANLPSWAGVPEATLTAAALRLESLGRVARRSSLYSTEPVGFADQPRFVNAVVALETELSPRQLLDRLLKLEQVFGRDRSGGVENGPRTLDLDILLLGDVEISEPGLDIPHPRLEERAFVLVPLREISPRIFDAGEGKTVSQFPHISGKKCESGADAVVRIQWDGWCAGSGDAGSGASCAADLGKPDHHGGG
jgi:2-amino-4-hydroxy-6-hydroxymethyldihydropteridine diphosphokinase